MQVMSKGAWYEMIKICLHGSECVYRFRSDFEKRWNDEAILIRDALQSTHTHTHTDAVKIKGIGYHRFNDFTVRMNDGRVWRYKGKIKESDGVKNSVWHVSSFMQPFGNTVITLSLRGLAFRSLNGPCISYESESKTCAVVWKSSSVQQSGTFRSSICPHPLPPRGSGKCRTPGSLFHGFSRRLQKGRGRPTQLQGAHEEPNNWT